MAYDTMKHVIVAESDVRGSEDVVLVNNLVRTLVVRVMLFTMEYGMRASMEPKI